MIIVISVILVVSVVRGIPLEDKSYENVEPRFVSLPDKDGNIHEVDLQAYAVDKDFIELISRDPGNEYWLYTRENPDIPQILELGNMASVTSSNFDPSRRTLVIAHGGFHTGLNEPNPIMRSVYFPKHDANIITVDWRKVAQNDYVTAVLGVPAVGRAVGDFILFLVTNFGLRYENLHFVGFSLGAHVVGIAGRQLGGNVARITGLDPAGPLWINNDERLSPEDGIYVEAIHTDGGYPGTGVGIGLHISQVDFFPNGGIWQPGCLTNVCNHNRAYQLFASSITHNHLIGRRCLNYTQIAMNLCTGVIMHMGNDDLQKTGTRGMYRLSTGANYPY